jgi:hypothetical protein
LCDSPYYILGKQLRIADFFENKGAFILRQIRLTEVHPGMILARNLYSRKGHILLAAGVRLTEVYLHKLRRLKVKTLFIHDERYADITIPEYLSIETQQRAFSILSSTMEFIIKKLLP